MTIVISSSSSSSISSLQEPFEMVQHQERSVGSAIERREVPQRCNTEPEFKRGEADNMQLDLIMGSSQLSWFGVFSRLSWLAP